MNDTERIFVSLQRLLVAFCTYIMISSGMAAADCFAGDDRLFAEVAVYTIDLPVLVLTVLTEVAVLVWRSTKRPHGVLTSTWLEAIVLFFVVADVVIFALVWAGCVR